VRRKRQRHFNSKFGSMCHLGASQPIYIFLRGII
jgi:hypothetical protein